MRSNGTKDVKNHEWFKSKGFSWDLLEDKKLKAPWVPKLKGDHDVLSQWKNIPASIVQKISWRPKVVRGW